MKRGKKGAISLETLVKFIPHIIVTLVVLAVFGGLLITFITKPMTTEMKDFERIIAEIDYLKEQPYTGIPQTITVPVQKESPLDLYFFPAFTGDAPLECKNNACICLYTKDSRICKAYPDIERTCDTCGPICLDTKKHIIRTSPTKLTIMRDCNEIIFS